MLNKKDKKFIAAMMFCQMGVIMATIALQGMFWSEHTVSLMNMSKDIKHAVEEDIREWSKEQIKKKNCKQPKIKI